MKETKKYQEQIEKTLDGATLEQRFIALNHPIENYSLYLFVGVGRLWHGVVC